MDPKKLALVSTNVGALPLVRRMMGRLGIDELFERHLTGRRLGRKAELDPARALSVMVANVLLCREPLYGVARWAGGFRPDLFGMGEHDARLLNDDRIGRALDRLFQTERTSTLMTAIVTKAVREFSIDLDRVHNDTTTVTFSGAYEGQQPAAADDRP